MSYNSGHRPSSERNWLQMLSEISHTQVFSQDIPPYIKDNQAINSPTHGSNIQNYRILEFKQHTRQSKEIQAMAQRHGNIHHKSICLAVTSYLERNYMVAESNTERTDKFTSYII